HVRHEDLVVPLLGERLAEALAEEGEPSVGEVEQLLGIPLQELPERLAAEQTQVVTTACRPDLVEGTAVHHGDIRRQLRGVTERPPATPALVPVEILYLVGPGVAGDRPGLVRVDHETMWRLEVRLVEACEGIAGPVGLEGRPDVYQLVERVDGLQDRGP